MGMKTQLAQTHTLMQFVDPELCSYLGKDLQHTLIGDDVLA